MTDLYQAGSLVAALLAIAGSALANGPSVEINVWVLLLLTLLSPRDIWEIVRDRAGLETQRND